MLFAHRYVMLVFQGRKGVLFKLASTAYVNKHCMNFLLN